MGNTERRKFERLEKEVSIFYQQSLSLEITDAKHETLMLDCSGGGVRFLAGEYLKKNTQLLIEMPFVGWSEIGDDWQQTGQEGDVGTLRAIGSVMWCLESESRVGEYEIGARFTGRISI